MKAWLRDIPDQLALALVVARSGISCGERIALIVVDNAVEYMLVAFIESHRRLVRKAISKKDWDEKKRHFEPLLDFIVAHCPTLASHRDDILNFHELRNSLYHTGQPVSVNKQKVEDYLALARQTFEKLFGVSFKDNDVEQTASRIHTALLRETRRETSATVTLKKENGFVRFETGAKPTNSDAICLVLYGFGREFLRPPSFNEVLESLRASGFSLTQKILSSRLYELRKKGWVRQDELALTSSGRKHLVKHYLT